MKSLYQYYSHKVLCAVAAIVSLTCCISCTDDSLNSPDAESRYIRFNVKEGDTKDISTRGGNSSLKITELEGTSEDLYLVPRTEDGIAKGTSSTRAKLINSETIETFGVFAGYSTENNSDSYSPDYMYNVEITRNRNWTPEDNFLWPGSGSLHFNAYSPYFESNGKSGSQSDTEGITSISSGSGSVLLTYSTPSEVTDQEELLFSTPKDASASPCDLTFSHALTAIKFMTGAELVPLTIKSITISGVKSKGALNLETGIWIDLSDESSYTINPNLSLSAEDGGNYVTSGIAITSDDEEFLLLPQELGENALISIAVEMNGKETTMTSSLSGQSWVQGKTITYRISGNPEADSLELNISGTFETQFTGSHISFGVHSSLANINGSTPVAWKAELVDDDGNVISIPNWISSFTSSGSGGNETGEITTMVQDMYFDKITPESQALQNATNINKSSGYTPYNLSSSTGSQVVENTANTYIINAPGTYSIPLVYGNAIKNGAANTKSYSTTTHKRNTLKTFLNHLGAGITDPYIYNNASCNPDSADLIWEDELNLVRNVRLSSDKKFIFFDIPQNTIRQGNAIIAIKDANGNNMWSWHIWITNVNPDKDYSSVRIQSSTSTPINESTQSVDILNNNLGNIRGGDRTTFPECEVKIRFTQINVPGDLTPLTKTVTLHQSGQTFDTPYCNMFYQWGRKDPMMSSIKQWFNADHSEIETLPTASATNMQGDQLIEEFIKHPSVFYTGNHSTDSKSNTPYPYINLWNIGQDTTDIKTIYDPSPDGYKVPYREPYFSIANNNSYFDISFVSDNTDTQQKGYYINTVSGGRIGFHVFGYRSGSTGILATGDYATYWVASATLTLGHVIEFQKESGSPSAISTQDPLFHGFSVRPVRE